MASADVAPPMVAPEGPQILRKLSELPMVNMTWGYAAQTYGKVKEANPLINYTLSTAERSVLYAQDQARPLVQKLGKPIEMVDDLACKGLGKIEQLAPAIKKTPSEILDDTKQLYNSTVVQRYEGLKNYSTEKVTALLGGSGQLVLDTTESYLDYLFPEVEGAAPDQAAKGLRERVEQLPGKVGRRVYANLIARSHDTLGKLNQTLLVMQYARENLSAATRQQLETTAAWVWAELSKAPGAEGLDGNRLLGLARNLSNQMVQTFQTALAMAPADLQERLLTAKTQAIDLLAHFNQAQVVSDLTTSILGQITQKLRSLEQVLRSTQQHQEQEEESSEETSQAPAPSSPAAEEPPVSDAAPSS